MSFVHLHVHSEYSLVDSIIRIPKLIEQVKLSSMPAIAITEQSNFFSAIKFYREAQKNGVKPIIGVEVQLATDYSDHMSRVILLCQNYEGYKNATQLINKSYVEDSESPKVNPSWIADYHEGLIMLSGGVNGDIAKFIYNDNFDLAEKRINYWLSIFGDRYYLELQRINYEHEEKIIYHCFNYACQYKLPLVATNNVCFLRTDDFEAHEARVCINHGYVLDDHRRTKLHTSKQYLRSADEMKELFSDLPESIENTLQISKRCNIEFTLGQNFLPHFSVEGDQNEHLKKITQQGLLDRLADQIPVNKQEIYQLRIEKELFVIIKMGFSGYFLIVADFVKWAKQNDIPVGVGRGSGAGSLVAYVLGITEIDPIKYDLLFERFLNQERISLPDFDIDFCIEGRDKVIDYVAQRYGHDRVSQIITFGRMAAKAVVRDVGRVLGFPYNFVDRIAKLIPFNLDITLKVALKEEKELKKRYDLESDVKKLFDLAQKLEGLARNAGRHAGGLVISPKPLFHYTPTYKDKDSVITVTHFDMKDLENIGLVKFDFLGLKTLTTIHRATHSINNQIEGVKIDINKIPLDDKKTFKLITRAETNAIFQLESAGVRKIIKELKPNRFDDIVALVALHRPGPLRSGMVDNFTKRRHEGVDYQINKDDIEYFAPELGDILKPTYGLILYQEQVMSISQVLAGYTLGAADILRRAMGKKQADEMAKQEDTFVKGSVANGINQKDASEIFKTMNYFAEYGFNKSHSVAYAMIAYQTAWLKANYTEFFMAAVLSSEMDNIDKVAISVRELRQMGIELLPPSINHGEYYFKVVDQKKISYGLGTIKGVNYSTINGIIEERNKNKYYVDLFDFCKRTYLNKLNRRVLESLVKSGALDELGTNRHSMFKNLENAMSFAAQNSSNFDSGQGDIFDFNEKPMNNTDFKLDIVKEWDRLTLLSYEKEMLGFYLTGHPIDNYRNEISQFAEPLGNIAEGKVTIAGYIENIKRFSKSGVYEIELDDNTSNMVVKLYTEQYEEYKSYIMPNRFIIVSGRAIRDKYYQALAVTAEEVVSMDEMRDKAIVELTIDKNLVDVNLSQQLKDKIELYQNGQCRVIIQYISQEAQATVLLGDNWKIHLNDELLQFFIDKLGQESVKIQYH